MYATVHTAQVLDAHRAAGLVRETELIRAQRERLIATEHPLRRPTAFAVVTDWLTRMMHRRPRHAGPRIA